MKTFYINLLCISIIDLYLLERKQIAFALKSKIELCEFNTIECVFINRVIQLMISVLIVKSRLIFR